MAIFTLFIPIRSMVFFRYTCALRPGRDRVVYEVGWNTVGLDVLEKEKCLSPAGVRINRLVGDGDLSHTID